MDDDSDFPLVISTQKRKHCTGLPASPLPKVNKKKGQSSFYIRSAYTQNIIARADKMNHLRKVIQC